MGYVVAGVVVGLVGFGAYYVYQLVKELEGKEEAERKKKNEEESGV